MGGGGRSTIGAGASAAWARITGRGGVVVIGWLAGAGRAGTVEAMAAGTLYCGAGMAYWGANCCAGIIGGPPNMGAGHPAGPQPAPERAGLVNSQQTAPSVAGNGNFILFDPIGRSYRLGLRAKF